jgi:type I restriction enzyme R subunit
MPCGPTAALGRFVRSLVGLDQAAAKQAFAGFLDGKVLTADQLEFIDHIVDHLTARGVMDPKLLYESPFTVDLADETENGWQKTQLRKLGRDFPKRSMIPLWGDAAGPDPH